MSKLSMAMRPPKRLDMLCNDNSPIFPVNRRRRFEDRTANISYPEQVARLHGADLKPALRKPAANVFVYTCRTQTVNRISGSIF
jgi:hypothetical protein